MWRLVYPHENQALIEMCRELYREDPSPKPVSDEHMIKTLSEFHKNPLRGCAMVLEVDKQLVGYALLPVYWSNELSGEITLIDELYVKPSYRSRGHGSALIKALVEQNSRAERVAVDLEVTPQNARALELYSKLGFSPAKNTHMRFRFN